VSPTSVSEGGVGNQTVTYTYTVTNTSPASTDPVSILTLTDSQLGVLTGSPTCQVGTVLAPGASCSFTKTVTLAEQNANTPLSNPCPAAGNDDENNVVIANATATINITDLPLHDALPNSVSPTTVSEGGVGNQTVTYTYTVTNTSPAT